ncbi:NrfD/PsrC family molybdoenzyme membrane anchor subunit [uncultured Chloroflexus sp.]|uniref:NrfD/PsrC family molybdoenzyme membrane anchor subunit n=1 Tax=uncultured Chloroflexus sp. TaxID=214040 RepID=UPI00262B611F|nr:NrfD/PsrC family molybdoenzyme membrane anchor subunit [uncultured Chloroflexus sp.]
MTNYGFLIDQRKCIGCHACSTACKSENEVPLGVYRTWVKYVETGTFPNTRRHFQVTRCNHCANPPCVRICPVTAMYQRTDGIVEFDPKVCIGCKACMQACPYDAIYIDPDTHNAAKCHFCAHRVDQGLKPACEIVCPEQAIISGDLDDPNSLISQLIAREPVSVRKPEQGTAPKLFYIDADQTTLTPTASTTSSTFMWADVVSEQLVGHHHGNGNGRVKAAREVIPLTAASGAKIRPPREQGLGIGQSALMMGGRVAGHMVQTAYNAQHKIPWHWPVPAYLVTKGIGSGVFLAIAVAVGLGLAPLAAPLLAITLFVSLLFIGITTGLLVFDLDKPHMFFTILTRPQWRSWLTRGAFILIGFTGVAGLWFLAEAGAAFNLWPEAAIAGLRPLFAWVGIPLAVMAAIYTAFLFAQAEGRDLWQSPLLPAHLLVQALMVGAGTLLLMAPFVAMPAEILTLLGWLFAGGLALDLFMLLLGEFGIPHASEVAARAAHDISHGRYRRHFWQGAIGVGHVAPLALIALALLAPALAAPLLAVAGLAAIAGLYAFEYAFVMAPQHVPNS